MALDAILRWDLRLQAQSGVSGKSKGPFKRRGRIGDVPPGEVKKQNPDRLSSDSDSLVEEKVYSFFGVC